jgi:uncharacterized protein
MSVRPEIGMVVVQPTAFCNIDCTYCYLPDRNNKHLIEQSTVERLFAEVFASGWACPELTVVWHAGEPLVAPIAFYREAFATIERLRPEHVAVRHSFQTNGILIDDEWCALFRDWDVGVGVSIDGPRALHDRHRKTRNGAGTFDRSVAGVRCLRANKVPFHVISVLSRESLAMPDELLAFYIEEGIEQVCFNVEESEGDHVSSLFAANDLRQRYASFLRTFWHAARASGRVQFVREIDLALRRVFCPEGTPTRNIQVEPLGMLNVDSFGNVSSFSPELLGLKSDAYGDYVFGNITTQSLKEIGEACLQSDLYRDIRLGVKACSACEYFSVCAGGAPVNKLFENGAFASGRTAYCELTQMVPIDLILEAYDSLEQSWTRDDQAVPADRPPPLPTVPTAVLPSRMP